MDNNTVLQFIDFEKQQRKSNRSGIEMYDVKGHYKYLTFSELVDYYFQKLLPKSK